MTCCCQRLPQQWDAWCLQCTIWGSSMDWWSVLVATQYCLQGNLHVPWFDQESSSFQFNTLTLTCIFFQIWPVSHKIKTFEISRESGSLNFAISKCFKPFCVRSFIAQFPKCFQPTVSIYLLPGFLNCPVEDVAEVDTQRLRTMDFYGGEARWKRKNSRNCAPFRNCSIEYNI